MKISKPILSITTIIIVASTVISFTKDALVNGLNTNKAQVNSNVNLTSKKSLAEKYQYEINHNAYGVDNIDKASLAMQNNL